MKSEYDAFGPWIYEIDEEHPLPELFEPYVVREGAITLMKIPRQIERRNASPDMQLYDYVIGAYKNRVSIFKRIENSMQVMVLHAFYKDVSAISIYNHLLSSRTTIKLSNGETLEIPFNTIAMETMQKFVDIVRRCSNNEASSPWKLTDQPDSIITDTLFKNLLDEGRIKNPNVKVGAFQKTVSFPPVLLSGTLSLYDDKELIIIERDLDVDHGGGKFGFKYTYIPLSHIDSVEVIESPHYDRLYTIDIKLQGNNQEVEIFTNNTITPDFYRQFK